MVFSGECRDPLALISFLYGTCAYLMHWGPYSLCRGSGSPFFFSSALELPRALSPSPKRKSTLGTLEESGGGILHNRNSGPRL